MRQPARIMFGDTSYERLDSPYRLHLTPEHFPIPLPRRSRCAVGFDHPEPADRVVVSVEGRRRRMVVGFVAVDLPVNRPGKTLGGYDVLDVADVLVNQVGPA